MKTTPTIPGLARATLTLATLTLAALILVAVPTTAAPPSTTDVCHHDEATGAHQLLTLPEQAAANHLGNHPLDVAAVDGGCPPPLPPGILARATTVDPDTGAAVLVGQLVDVNASGTPDAGDRYESHVYPLDQVPTALGAFSVTSHEVASGAYDVDGDIEVVLQSDVTPAPTVAWSISENMELFIETSNPGATALADTFAPTWADGLNVRPESPSSPADSISIYGDTNSGDNTWLDIQLAPAPGARRSSGRPASPVGRNVDARPGRPERASTRSPPGTIVTRFTKP